MKSIRPIVLSAVLSLAGSALAQSPSPDEGATPPNGDPPAGNAPAKPPAPPQQGLPPPPNEDGPQPNTPPPPNGAVAQQGPADEGQQTAPTGAPDGQWVYTNQYGWTWMPYADEYTYTPEGETGTPSMYLYSTGGGWGWVAAPWIWGIGPRPYFAYRSWYRPGHYGWYGQRGWHHPFPGGARLRFGAPHPYGHFSTGGHGGGNHRAH